MILYAAEFIFQSSLGFKPGNYKSHIILSRNNNNAKLKIVRKSHSSANNSTQSSDGGANIQATGPFVLLYQSEPKRCVPLEVGHMLLSDGGLFFSEFTDEDIPP